MPESTATEGAVLGFTPFHSTIPLLWVLFVLREWHMWFPTSTHELRKHYFQWPLNILSGWTAVFLVIPYLRYLFPKLPLCYTVTSTVVLEPSQKPVFLPEDRFIHTHSPPPRKAGQAPHEDLKAMTPSLQLSTCPSPKTES